MHTFKQYYEVILMHGHPSAYVSYASFKLYFQQKYKLSQCFFATVFQATNQFSQLYQKSYIGQNSYDLHKLDLFAQLYDEYVNTKYNDNEEKFVKVVTVISEFLSLYQFNGKKITKKQHSKLLLAITISILEG